METNGSAFAVGFILSTAFPLSLSILFSLSLPLGLLFSQAFARTPVANIAQLTDLSRQREYLARKNTTTSLLNYYPQSYQDRIHKSHSDPWALAFDHNAPDSAQLSKLSANYSSAMLTLAVHSRNLVASAIPTQHSKKSGNSNNNRKTKHNTRGNYWGNGFNGSDYHVVIPQWYEREIEVCQIEYPLECVSQCDCESEYHRPYYGHWYWVMTCWWWTIDYGLLVWI